MKLEYDIPEEVTEKQFRALIPRCGGIICGRKEGDKYFIKLWLTKYREHIKKIINAN